MSWHAGIPINQLPPGVRAQVLARAKRAAEAADPRTPLEVAQGKRRPRRPRPVSREHAEQEAVVAWAAEPEQLARFPELDVLYAIPNESFGLRDGIAKKARGRRAGMPDLCLPVPRRDGTEVYGACYIEMKDLAGSVRASQQDRIALLRVRGNFADVAASASAAKALLLYYLSLPRP